MKRLDLVAGVAVEIVPALSAFPANREFYREILRKRRSGSARDRKYGVFIEASMRIPYS